MLADTAEDFGRACIELIKNPARGAELAAKGWRDFLEKWTWDAIAPKVWTAAEDCLRRSKR
jgi:glycosyltransferase involved in cell wall biosynthesis